MKNKKEVHHGTGWAQLECCASCPRWHSEVFEVGQRNMLKSCDCLSCPRCPGEISNSYKAVKNTVQSLSDGIYKPIENYLGHLGHVGQLPEMMMEKLSQGEELPRTELGQETGEKHLEAQPARLSPPQPVVIPPRPHVLVGCWLSTQSRSLRSCELPCPECLNSAS